MRRMALATLVMLSSMYTQTPSMSYIYRSLLNHVVVEGDPLIRVVRLQMMWTWV